METPDPTPEAYTSIVGVDVGIQRLAVASTLRGKAILILPRFERVPEAEIDSKQVRKGHSNGKDPEGLFKRIERGSSAARTDIGQADRTNRTRMRDLRQRDSWVA
jgi:hypothetical protein